MANMVFTNRENISPLLAVWLAKNDYYIGDQENLISATTLLKPVRQVVLARQNKDLNKLADVADLVNSRMGTAIHDSVEKAWTTDEPALKDILTQFGLDEDTLTRIKINPEPSTVTDEDIPVYIEQRYTKDVTLDNGEVWTVSGAFDAVIHGVVEDIKTTSVWTHIYGSNDKKYADQMSTYKWIKPEIITEDYGRIQHLFTDWSSQKARTDKQYPQSRILTKELTLDSIVDTAKIIKNKLEIISKFEKLDPAKLPLCTDEELWREKDVFKYYKDKNKTTGRSTANFDTMEAAQARLMKDSNSGTIIKYPGGVKACKYCAVQNVCSQYKDLKLTGQIKE